MSAKDTVERYLYAFFGGRPDLDTVRSLLADEFSFEGPTMKASNPDDFIRQIKGMAGGKKIRAEIHHLIEDGGRVAALYDFVGPGGKTSFAEWFWVRAGKISAIKLHFDPRPFLDAAG